MKFKVSQPLLPALALPLLTGAALGQTMGTAHPEQLNDPTVVTSAATQSDHYVKPSHAAASSASQAYTAAQSTAPVTSGYATSFPATGPAPNTTAPATTGAAPVTATEAAIAGSADPVDPGADPNPGYRMQGQDSGAAPVVRRRLPATAPTGERVPPTTYRPSAAARAEAEPAYTNGGDTGNDNGIVLEVPTRPHELNSGTLLHARLREALNTQTTAKNSVFTAELLTDVGHHGEVMLPAGSLIRGHITSVHGGKRITGGAALHLRPETISLPDGTLYRFQAQLTDLNSTQDLRVNDEGTVVLRSNPKAAAGVIGGVAATAAVTGAVIGGGIGAGVGAIAGAAIATAVYLKRDIQESLPAGTDVIFALDQPLTVTAR